MSRHREAIVLLRELLDLDEELRLEALHERCGDDRELIVAVEALLSADAEAENDSRWQAPLSLQPGDDALVGSLLGAYRVVEQIGEGGVGRVYRAVREGDFAQEVAIKVIRRGLDSDDILARFVRERRILASLSHPHLARFIDGGLSPGGRPWFALQLVRGTPINEWCDRRRLGVNGRVRLFLDACAAVQHAHEHLVVHRDLKPGNILVDDAGHLSLLDFGLAKLLAPEQDRERLQTAVGAPVLLTPEYAAPEQINGGTSTVATDVYSLGVVLFELISGVLPYEVDRRDWRQTQSVILDRPPMRLSQAITRATIGREPTAASDRLRSRGASIQTYRRLVRGDLERILTTALAKEPERRYPTVQALADDLRRFLAGQPVTVTGSHRTYRLRKFVGRNRLGVTLGALAVALAGIGAGGIVWQWQEATRQASLARAEASRANAVRDYLILMFREARELSADDELSAREVLERSAQRIETVFADDPPTRQSVLAAMAELYVHLQDFQGALPLLERFTALEDGSSPDEARVTALDDLAVVHLRRGDTLAALDAVQQAMAIIESSTSASAVMLEARVLATRGQIRRALGRIEEAIADLERAVHLAEAREGPRGRQGAVARNSLAATYMAAGRMDDALAAFEAALDAYDELGLGDGHEALNVLNNWGSLAFAQGRMDEAEEILRRALQTRELRYGPSAALGAVSVNYAQTLMSRDELDAAGHHLERGRALLERFAGPESIDVGSAELALAGLALRRRDGGLALEHADQALERFQPSLGESHPLVARALAVRAEALALGGEAD